MVKKITIANNPENNMAIKKALISPILLFIILMFFSIFQFTGCISPEKSTIYNKTTEESKPINIEQNLNYIPDEITILPEPKLDSGKSLEQALLKRRSVRTFSDEEIELEKISQLLWSAQGITKKPEGFRTAPSAGALYPLDVFVAKKDGLFHYIPDKNMLMKLVDEDLRYRLYEASLYQAAVAEGAIDIIITAVYERTMVKYGERGTRYVHLEAGHACQNILLQAVVLELGAVPIGAFEDDKVREIMQLPDNYTPLYVIPVGYPE